MSTDLAYRIRIRNASTVANPDGTADDLIISSVRGGTNPYVAAVPRGDGQELDPLAGTVRSGAYNVQVIDAITSGTTRVLTSKMFDAAGRQTLLSRRAYIEISTDGGGTWPVVLIAGYVLGYRFTDALLGEIQVGDTPRVVQNFSVFDGYGNRWTKRGTLFGGPIIGGWGPFPDRGGWIMRATATTAVAGGHIVDFVALQGYGGPSDPVVGVPGLASGSNVGLLDSINEAAAPYYAPAVAPFNRPGFPGLVAYLPDFNAGATKGRFTPTVPSATSTGILKGFGTTFAVFWPSSVTLATVGQEYRMHLIAAAVAEVSPLYLTEHPIDLVTKLWTDAGIRYDAASAAAVRALLGDTLRISMRITRSQKLDAFLTSNIFGPFGVAARANAAGVLELFTTRVKSAAAPGTTISTNDLRSGSEIIFDADEASVINVVRFTTKKYSTRKREPGLSIALDAVLETENETLVESGNVTSFGTKEQAYKVDGLIHDALEFGPGVMLATDDTVGGGIPLYRAALVEAVALEIFDRFGQGAPSGEMRVLRASDTGLKIGDEVLIDPVHLPNLNKRLGDDPTVGARVVQIVRRTEEPGGPFFRFLDAGSSQQPASPAATISIAASADNPRSVAEFTITNAAAINATGLLLVAIDWATGASAPSVSGGKFIRYKAGSVPTGAVSLPSVAPGSKVWVRARTEQNGRRASAWTAWTSVTLTALAAPSALAFTNLRQTGAQFNWTNGSATDPVDVFVYQGASAPADWTPYFVTSLEPGSVAVFVRHLSGPGVQYVGAVMHRDAATGARSAAATATFTTNSTLDNADELRGLSVIETIYDASLPNGIALALYASDEAFDIEIERAPDVAGVAGAYTLLATVPGTTQVYVDLLPADGATRWYRARTTLSGYTPSAYTEEVSAAPSSIPPKLTRPLVPLVLSIVMSIRNQGATQSGNLSIQCNDLTGSFKYKISNSSYPSAATVRASGTLVNNTQGDATFAPVGDVYVSVIPWGGVGATGREGPLHRAKVINAPIGIAQGTVLVHDDGTWDATIDAPPGTTDLLWYASTSGFPTRTDVITLGATLTHSPPFHLSGGPLALGERIYISAIPLGGVESPLVRVLGSYQSFFTTKTYSYAAAQFVQAYTNFTGTSNGTSYGIYDGAGLRVDNATASAIFADLVGFAIALIFPAGVTLIEMDAYLFRDGGITGSRMDLNGGSLASCVASPTGTWANYVATLSQLVSPGDTFYVTCELVADPSDPTNDFTKVAAAIVALTFTMPTPVSGL